MRNAKVLVGDDEDLRSEIENLWQALENYKGKKAALRKINKIDEAFEAEGKALKKRKELRLRRLQNSPNYISVVEDIKRLYEEMGYTVHMDILNSAWYGAATKRERLIIVAIRNDVEDIFEYPQPQYMDQSIYKSGLDRDLLNLPSPKTVNDALKLVDYEDEDDIDNLPMNHSEKTIRRFKYIPEGDNIANHMDLLPEELKISKFYSRGATMRLDGTQPSPTLVPGHSNFPVHPKEHRSITVREAATITGFPLKYKFFGNHSKRCEHVGNAVPPPLARALAQSCKKVLDNYYKNQ